jgi:AcrR family transcriptional regulator
MARMAVEERRALLLDAALTVMARDGVNAASTRAIATHAAMPLASFHYCFRNREEMLAELIGIVVRSESLAVLDAMASAVTRAQTPRARLVAILRRGSRGYLAHVAANAGAELALNELNHLALRTPSLQSLALEQYRSYYRAAEEILHAAATQSGVRWTAPIPMLARLVTVGIHGATATWLVDRDTEATLATLDAITETLATCAKPDQRVAS